MHKKTWALCLAFACALLLLTGCQGLPEQLQSLPLPWAAEEPESDPNLILGPGLDGEGLAGAEWGVFEMLYCPRPASLEEPSGYTVYIPESTPVFYSPQADGRTDALLPAGESLEVEPSGDPLWFSFADGWLYGEDLFLAEDGQPEGPSLAQWALAQRLRDLEKRLPAGSYWNHMGRSLPLGLETPFSVTDIPCDHTLYGQQHCNWYSGSALGLLDEFDHLCQCLGFACLLSDQLFGRDAPQFLLDGGVPLRVGDHIRLGEYEHSMVVQAVSEEGFTVAEVNPGYEDCLIVWGRDFTWAEWETLYAWDVVWVISRYPLYRKEGQLLAWEPTA